MLWTPAGYRGKPKPEAAAARCRRADVPGEDEGNISEFGNEVRQLFLDTLRLSTKSKNIPFEQPAEIKDMDSAALSFWCADTGAAADAQRRLYP